MAIEVIDVLFPSQAAPQGRELLESKTVIRSLRNEIKFDAVLSRGHGRASEIPQSPLEDGSSVNDHVILAPRSLTMEAMVSDHPIAPAQDDIAAAAADLGDTTRSVAAAFLLEFLWQTKATLKIVTRLRIYESMVIDRLDFTESNDVGQSLAVTISLTEIRKASLTQVKIAKLAPATSDLAAGKVNRGRRATKAVTKQQEIDSIRKANASAGVGDRISVDIGNAVIEG